MFCANLLLLDLFLLAAVLRFAISQNDFYYPPVPGPPAYNSEYYQPRWLSPRERRRMARRDGSHRLNVQHIIGPRGERNKGRKVLDRLADWIAGIPVGTTRQPPSTNDRRGQRLPRPQSWRAPPTGFQPFAQFPPLRPLPGQTSTQRQTAGPPQPGNNPPSKDEDKPEFAFSLDYEEPETQQTGFKPIGGRFHADPVQSIRVEPEESIRSLSANRNKSKRRDSRRNRKRPEQDFDPIPDVTEEDRTGPLEDLDYFEDPRYVPPADSNPYNYFEIQEEPQRAAVRTDAQENTKEEIIELRRASDLIRHG